MPNKAERLTYKSWSGIRIKGTEKVPVPYTDLHIDRAAYLATSLESPNMGAVQSYDRAGMSGGPFHFTAIQPGPMVQGSLFNLLRYLEVTAPCTDLDRLWEALAKERWFVARDGTLRNIDSGVLIPAGLIRHRFAPPQGKVPESGPDREQAEYWARLFHNLLSNPVTYKAQQEFAVQYLISGQKSFEAAYYTPHNILTLRSGIAIYDRHKEIFPLEIDLALCVYHGHSVNAPGPAKRCLEDMQKKFAPADKSVSAAKYLIWRLGRYKYGRWQDTTDDRNRYDHTRIKAMQSGLWPKEFFVGANALMPKDLNPNTYE